MLQKIAEEEKHDLKLIAGDMNLLPEEIAKLAAPDLLQGDCLLPTAGGAKRVKKLDYIFILGADKTQIQLTTKRIDSKYNFSDHSPVFGKIRLSD
jgi:endonuclease/exonuclease/phosphatase family metal-dependent hydrolase